MKIHVTAFYDGTFSDFAAVHKDFDLPAVPRVGDYLDIEEVDAEVRVTEVHFGLDGSVGIAVQLRISESVEILRGLGWT